MAHLSRRIRESLSPQPAPLSSSNEGSFSPSDMTTTPQLLQAGPRKLQKSDNVKNRMSLAFRKTFSKPPIETKVVSLIAPPRAKPVSSPSSSLPSYAAASSSPSRGYFGQVPEVVRQGSIGTATRESGRSNKPQPLSTEGLVPRRSHLGAGAVGTSPPLPPIPLPPMTVAYEGQTRTTFKAPVDGLGIALDLSPTQPSDRSPSLTPRTHSSPEFPVLANVSHVSTVAHSVPSVEPLRFENSRDRLVRTRASISASSDYELQSKPRGANRAADRTKCYTMAAYPTSETPLPRPPKSTLRTKAAISAAPEPTQDAPPRVATAWKSRSAPSSRKASLVVPVASSSVPTNSGLYCLRPTVDASTQTPPDWHPSVSTSRRASRRFSASTPPQAYSSFFGAVPARRESVDHPPPSPSVYSIASVDTRRGSGSGHRRHESLSSFYGATDQIREGDEDLQAAIDRHLGELKLSQAGNPAIVAVEYDVPFLDPCPYDTPQLRPFEIPPTPLALAPLASQGLAPSPAFTSELATPTFDRTPTLPPLRSTETPSPTVSTEHCASPSSSTSSRSSGGSEGSEGSDEDDDSGSLTPPTSVTSSNFEDVVSIQLAEQEPITMRKASLVPSTAASSRKSSLVPAGELRRDSLHSRKSSLSAKSVSFHLVEPAPPTASAAAAAVEPEYEARAPTPEPLHYASPLRRRSESDKPIPRLRAGAPGGEPHATMSREERALKGRSFFLVQALMGEEVPREGMIRDWARDTDDEGEGSDGGSIADSEM
ncbi:hypothetical protein JCM11491_002363 [Sporobolomyces phaffii]